MADDLFVPGLVDSNFKLYENVNTTPKTFFSPVVHIDAARPNRRFAPGQQHEHYNPALIADAAQFFINQLNDDADEVRIIKFAQIQ